MSPWNKCTHRHEGMQLQDDPRVCLWAARTETQQEWSWQGKLVRFKGAGSGGTCVPGGAISRCGSVGSAHHGDSFGVVWSLVGRKGTK